MKNIDKSNRKFKRPGNQRPQSRTGDLHTRRAEFSENKNIIRNNVDKKRDDRNRQPESRFSHGAH